MIIEPHRKRLLGRAACGVCAATTFLVAGASAATYYLSPSGNDSANGTSASSPWRTIDRANQADLAPGDAVLLQGGQTFPGRIYIAPGDSGTLLSPVVFGSYGTGRATINGGTGGGVYAYNVGGVIVRDLIVAGSGIATNQDAGVLFYADSPTGTKYLGVTIDNVDATGFRDAGIALTSWHSSLPGFQGATINNCRAYANGAVGITTWGYSTVGAQYSHLDVQITDCKAYNNPGDPGITSSHTGSGIVLGQVDGALVERCEAYGNGASNSFTGAGPLGMWCWDTRDAVFQYNISHHNVSGSGVDGGGFDLDGGSVDCVFQFNYSYSNQGWGFLVAQFQGAPPMTGNVIRYNISQNDGRGFSGAPGGAIGLWRHASSEVVDGLDIHHNTIYVTPSNANLAAAILHVSGTFQNTYVANNVVVTTGGVKLASGSATASQVKFAGNLYWPSAGAFSILWNGTNYASLSAWRSGTGQEMVGATATGLQANPLLTSPGNGLALTDPYLINTLTAYRPLSGSPLINAGLDIAALFGVAPAPEDLYGVSLPQGAAFDIGAAEVIAQNSNVALGKAATISSGSGAGYLTDGILTDGSRWLAATGYPQWIEVNLGSVHTINQVIVRQHTERINDYQVLVPNGSGWQPVASGTGNTAMNVTASFTAVATDRVRFNVSAGEYNLKIYEFEIYGVVGGGSSGGDTQVPTVPAGLGATAASSSQINLSWTASSDNIGVTGYRIFRGGTQVGTSATTSYSDTGLNASTAYTYAVAAYDAIGNMSSQSSPAGTTTQGGSTNVALGKAVTVSSGTGASFLTDGQLTTTSRWFADYGYPQWAEVNLGGTYTVSQVVFSQNTERTDGWQVQVWNGSAWTTVASGSGNTSMNITASFAPVSTTKVRFVVTTGELYLKVYELEVFGSAGG